jgi:hypothetical protein
MLRMIALFVDEPDPGVYHWVLVESQREAAMFEPLQASLESFTNYALALSAGFLALQGLSQDLATGPRWSIPPSSFNGALPRPPEDLPGTV